MTEYSANPSASISSAQQSSTGQNPCHVKNSAMLKENPQIEAKKTRADAGVSEQFGRRSMRCSKGRLT
jgi:hypothetical protein